MSSPYRVAWYVGAYAAAMDGRLDALVFTGGIGENAAMVREMVLARLALLGFKIDKANNAARYWAVKAPSPSKAAVWPW